MLFASKFTEGAWLLLLIVPGLMLLFDRIERYYYHVAEQLDLGRLPPKPVPGPSGDAMVIVPVVTISKVVGRALQVAMRLGGEVVPWPSTPTPTPPAGSASSGNNGTPGLTSGSCPPAPHPGGTRRRFRPNPSREGTLRHRLAPYIEPRRRRYRILHNQRGPLLATTVRARTDAIVATLPIRLD